MFTKKFGIEIEFAGFDPAQARRTLERNCGIATNRSVWNENLWALKEDGSVHGCEVDQGECENYDEDYGRCGQCPGCEEFEPGCEIVSPPMFYGPEAIENVRKMVTALGAIGGYVNETCGLHVHVNATFLRNWRPERTRRFFTHLCELYAKYENVFDSRMDDERRGNRNHYCRSMVGYSYERSDRYRKLNIEAFTQHGTIEFRHHHGTLDPDEVVNWIKTCLLFFNIAKETFYRSELETEYFEVNAVNVPLAHNNA